MGGAVTPCPDCGGTVGVVRELSAGRHVSQRRALNRPRRHVVCKGCGYVIHQLPQFTTGLAVTGKEREI